MTQRSGHRVFGNLLCKSAVFSRRKNSRYSPKASSCSAQDDTLAQNDAHTYRDDGSYLSTSFTSHDHQPCWWLARPPWGISHAEPIGSSNDPPLAEVAPLPQMWQLSFSLPCVRGAFRCGGNCAKLKLFGTTSTAGGFQNTKKFPQTDKRFVGIFIKRTFRNAWNGSSWTPSPQKQIFQIFPKS